MGKNMEKVFLGLACAGAAAGVLIAWKKERSAECAFKEDLKDFTDEFEESACQRTYTTIPYNITGTESLS
jgi:hypothetical protein